MANPILTPLFNRLKRIYTLANGQTSAQELIKKFSDIIQQSPEKAGVGVAYIFNEIVNKIGPNNPQHLKVVEQFLNEVLSTMHMDNPAIAEDQLEKIKKLNNVAKFQAMKQLLNNQQLCQFFAEFWQKFLNSENSGKTDLMKDILKTNFDKTFEDNKLAAQQMIYTPEGLLVSRFVRLLKTVFDMALVMADLEPMFKPEVSDGQAKQFYPMPGK